MSNKPTYELKNGQILRRGELVGCYDEKTGDILEISTAIPKQLVTMLKRMILEEINLPAPQGKTLVEVFAAEPKATELIDPHRLAENAGFHPHATEIPPEPPQGPEGDKTHAWAYWLRVYYPDKFAKRFAGRKVMGVHIPPLSGKDMLPDVPAPPASRPTGDIPESSMAKEAEEVWVRG